ncbi:hypothetical protein [Rhodococcus sp. MTM3W5.2]|uniref:hypothetical protein n=1 Tax=Rhodococcus sp. MTM3W5.2 TaxID=1805827 RepID=UPI001CB98416|nr:hypothetical protein [Rhodococcus sp. MTM3W5.2]
MRSRASPSAVSAAVAHSTRPASLPSVSRYGTTAQSPNQMASSVPNASGGPTQSIPASCRATLSSATDEATANSTATHRQLPRMDRVGMFQIFP